MTVRSQALKLSGINWQKIRTSCPHFSPVFQISILSAFCMCLFGEQLYFNMSEAFFHLLNKHLFNAFLGSVVEHKQSLDLMQSYGEIHN